jgi:hypothetical protein
MSDFIKEYEEETKLYHVEELGASPKYRISFIEENKAHDLMLALRLGAVKPPKEAPEAYRYLREAEGIIYFQALEKIDLNAEGEQGICCQSGCPGCPWAEENMR